MTYVDNVEWKTFGLSSKPVDFQLTVHFENIFNQGDPSKILDIFDYLLKNNKHLETYLTLRNAAPISFRAAQMIQHYGVVHISAFLKDTFKMKVGA